jgi:hypothetical protein
MQEQGTDPAPARKGHSSQEYMIAWRSKRKQHVRNYSIWYGIINRCHSKTSEKYPYYGGRGIAVCERWRSSLESFIEDMGDVPEGLSIDRIDNNGNYEPGNCRWVTMKEQCRNRRSNRHIEFDGKIKTIAEWAEVTGIPATVIIARIDKCGYSVEQSLTQPCRVCSPRKKKAVKDAT